ncbi:MAG: response regulator [Lachnospiraceae bacterium]|nr:response regulator [Lachnospiraceae bacterium]
MITDTQMTEQGLVLVVSDTDSFLASSLVSKLESEGIAAQLCHGRIKEVETVREKIELIILFLRQDLDEISENVVYLKDTASDLDRKIILIGEESQKKEALEIIPETLILEWFERPLMMDELMKCIRKYIEENTGDNRKKTVLIVDDDITYMRTVYEWLKDSYHVGMAASGVQAISYLARNKADLVLLDYEMPVANGPQVLEMLKNDSETGQIPVMFLTGHADVKSVLSVVSLSPVDYLLKSIDKETLLSKLKDFFDKRK